MNNNFDNKQNTNNLADFSDIDINDINLNDPQPSEKEVTMNYDENGFFNNLDDFSLETKLNIKILGIGGAGNNMIAHIAKNSSLDPKMLFAINTDYEVLKKMSNIPCSKVLIGKKTTSGYGSGSNPMVGQKAADEDRQTITKILQGVDLLFIVSGMGKGTGTGASPVVAEIAKELGILTIALVNIPSIQTEGKTIFEKGLVGTSNLKKHVDGLATINNDRVLGQSTENESLFNSFRRINQVICETISDLIYTVSYPSDINIDFNDVKNFFKDKTNFQITNCEFESNENSKDILRTKIASTLFENSLNGSKKAMLTLKLNPEVPSIFLTDVRQVMEEITENPNLELTYAVDYSEDINFAKISILVATDYFDDMVNEYVQNEGAIQTASEAPKLVTPIVNTIEEPVIVEQAATPPPPPLPKMEQPKTVSENPNLFINNMINEIEKISQECTNNENPANYNEAAEANKSYNLDELDSLMSENTNLQEQIKIAKTNNSLLQQSNTNKFAQSIPSNQNDAVSSTTLGKFVEKTLSLFKKTNNQKATD